MGEFDKGKGQDQGGDYGDKPDFDKQQDQQGGKPDQGQDKGDDFGKEGQDDYGGKPQQQ